MVRQPGAPRRVLCGTLAVAMFLTALPATPSAWADTSAAVATAAARLPNTGPGAPDLAALSIPESLGHVVETWQPSDAKGFVIHLQDLHVHPEAQQHLSELIGTLRDRLGIDLVALEGAEGACDTALYSDLPDPESTERVARLFMQEGLFTGAEYYAITHPGRVTLWGVEEEATYLEHLHTYQEHARTRSDAEATLTKLRDALTPRTATRYPTALQRLAHRREAYERDEPNAFEPYLNELSRVAKAKHVSLHAYPHVRAALRAYAFYRLLDMRAVTDDRARWLKAGPRTPVRYRTFRALRRYLAYQRASEALRSNELPDELSSIDEAVEAAWLSTEESRALARLLRRTELIDALIHAKLSARELDAYQSMRSALTPEVLWADLQSITHPRPATQSESRGGHPSPVTQPEIESLIRSLPPYERFYELALARDETLTRRTLAKLQEPGRHAAILVAGGFHTPGITQRLREQRIAYVVIAPAVTTPLDEARYQARLQLAIPPLEDLLKALDRQALVPPLATDPDSPTHAPITDRFLALKADAGGDHSGHAAADDERVTGAFNHVTYARADVEALRHVVQTTDPLMLIIAGGSGAGKSSLQHSLQIGALDVGVPRSDLVFLHGRDLWDTWHEISLGEFRTANPLGRRIMLQNFEQRSVRFTESELLAMEDACNERGFDWFLAHYLRTHLPRLLEGKSGARIVYLDDAEMGTPADVFASGESFGYDFTVRTVTVHREADGTRSLVLSEEPAGGPPLSASLGPGAAGRLEQWIQKIDEADALIKAEQSAQALPLLNEAIDHLAGIVKEGGVDARRGQRELARAEQLLASVRAEEGALLGMTVPLGSGGGNHQKPQTVTGTIEVKNPDGLHTPQAMMLAAFAEAVRPLGLQLELQAVKTKEWIPIGGTLDVLRVGSVSAGTKLGVRVAGPHSGAVLRTAFLIIEEFVAREPWDPADMSQHLAVELVQPYAARVQQAIASEGGRGGGELSGDGIVGAAHEPGPPPAQPGGTWAVEPLVIPVPVSAKATADEIREAVNGVLRQLKPALERFPLCARRGPLAVVEFEDETEQFYHLHLTARDGDLSHSIFLREVVKNAVEAIIANARTSTEQRFDGTMTLRMELTEQGWGLELSDNGEGIPNDVLVKLFRARVSTKGDLPRNQRVGGLGAAIRNGAYGQTLLKLMGAGPIEIETKQEHASAQRLHYDLQTDQMSIEPGTRQVAGTTIRWYFPNPTLSGAAHEAGQPPDEARSVSGRMTRHEASRDYLNARWAHRYEEAVDMALNELRVDDLWAVHGPTRQALSKERLAELIDPPLVGALDLLSQAGIFTIDSSANHADVERGFAYIELDPVRFQHPYGLTADERQRLERLEAQGFFTREFPHRYAFKFPITATTTVRQLHDQAVAIVSQFRLPLPSAAVPPAEQLGSSGDGKDLPPPKRNFLRMTLGPHDEFGPEHVSGGRKDSGGSPIPPAEHLTPEFETYLQQQGLAGSPALRPLFTPEIQRVLLDDPALRPVFVRRLPAEAVGLLEGLDEDTVSTLGGPSVLEALSVFSVGSAEVANRLLIEDPRVHLLVGVTDRKSSDTFDHFMTTANNRTVYFPLPDGTWLGVKGAGQFGEETMPPYYWNAQYARYEGLLDYLNGSKATTGRTVVAHHSRHWVQFLGYRRLHAATNGQGHLERLPALATRRLHAMEEGGSFEPILMFTRVREPHRLVKLPQLLKTDPDLHHLCQRVSKTLARLGEIERGRVLSPSELLVRIMSHMGHSEAEKQNAQYFKKTINFQDVTFAGEEGDVDELLPVDTYLREALHYYDEPAYEQLLERHGLDVLGINVKLDLLSRIMRHARDVGKERLMFPNRSEAFQAFWEGYFASLDDRSLRLWVPATTTQAPGPAMAGIAARSLDVFHTKYDPVYGSWHPALDQEMRAMIPRWAQAELQKRRGAEPENPKLTAPLAPKHLNRYPDDISPPDGARNSARSSNNSGRVAADQVKANTELLIQAIERDASGSNEELPQEHTRRLVRFADAVVRLLVLRGVFDGQTAVYFAPGPDGIISQHVPSILVNKDNLQRLMESLVREFTGYNPAHSRLLRYNIGKIQDIAEHPEWFAGLLRMPERPGVTLVVKGVDYAIGEDEALEPYVQDWLAHVQPDQVVILNSKEVDVLRRVLTKAGYEETSDWLPPRASQRLQAALHQMYAPDLRSQSDNSVDYQGYEFLAPTHALVFRRRPASGSGATNSRVLRSPMNEEWQGRLPSDNAGRPAEPRGEAQPSHQRTVVRQGVTIAYDTQARAGEPTVIQIASQRPLEGAHLHFGVGSGTDNWMLPPASMLSGVEVPGERKSNRWVEIPFTKSSEGVYRVTLPIPTEGVKEIEFAVVTDEGFIRDGADDFIIAVLPPQPLASTTPPADGTSFQAELPIGTIDLRVLTRSSGNRLVIPDSDTRVSFAVTGRQEASHAARQLQEALGRIATRMLASTTEELVVDVDRQPSGTTLSFRVNDREAVGWYEEDDALEEAKRAIALAGGFMSVERFGGGQHGVGIVRIYFPRQPIIQMQTWDGLAQITRWNHAASRLGTEGSQRDGLTAQHRMYEFQFERVTPYLPPGFRPRRVAMLGLYDNIGDLVGLIRTFKGIEELHLIDIDQYSRAFFELEHALEHVQAALASEGISLPRIYGARTTVTHLPDDVRDLDLVMDKYVFAEAYFSEGQYVASGREIHRALRPGGVHLTAGSAERFPGRYKAAGMRQVDTGLDFTLFMKDEEPAAAPSKGEKSNSSTPPVPAGLRTSSDNFLKYVHDGNRQRLEVPDRYKNHIENSSTHILEGAKGLSGTAMLLGFGNGMEYTPEALIALAEQFDRIALVDIDRGSMEQALERFRNAFRLKGKESLIAKFAVFDDDISGLLGALTSELDRVITTSPSLDAALPQIVRVLQRAVQEHLVLPLANARASYVVSSMLVTQPIGLLWTYIESLLLRRFNATESDLAPFFLSSDYIEAEHALTRRFQIQHFRDLHRWVQTGGKVYFSTDTQAFVAGVTRGSVRPLNDGTVRFLQEGRDAMQRWFHVLPLAEWLWLYDPDLDSRGVGEVFQIEADLLSPREGDGQPEGAGGPGSDTKNAGQAAADASLFSAKVTEALKQLEAHPEQRQLVIDLAQLANVQHDATAIPALLAVVTHHPSQHQQIRRDAARFLSSIVDTTTLAQYRPELTSFVQDPQEDEEISSHLALVLGRLGGPEDVKALAEALSDPRPKVCAHAASALGILGAPAATPAIPALRRAANHSSLAVRRAVDLALQSIEADSAVPPSDRLMQPGPETGDRQSGDQLARLDATVKRALHDLPVAAGLRVPEGVVWFGRPNREGSMRIKTPSAIYEINLRAGIARRVSGAQRDPLGLTATRLPEGQIACTIGTHRITIDPASPLMFAGAAVVKLSVPHPETSSRLLRVRLMLGDVLLSGQDSEDVLWAHWIELSAHEPCLSIQYMFFNDLMLPDGTVLDLAGLGILSSILGTVAEQTGPSVTVRITHLVEDGTSARLNEVLDSFHTHPWFTRTRASMAVATSWFLSDAVSPAEAAEVIDAVQRALPDTRIGKIFASAGYTTLAIDPNLLSLYKSDADTLWFVSIDFLARRPAAPPGGTNGPGDEEKR